MMSLLEAVVALPFVLVRWRESVDGNGVTMHVTCRAGNGDILECKQQISANELESFAAGEQLLAHHREQIVETFRRSHPERLPKGIGKL